MSEQVEKKPSFLRRLIRFIVRLVFVLVLGVALGAGIYYLATNFYLQYIQPLQDHEVRLNTLEAYQEEVNKQVGNRLSDLESRLVEMETFNDTHKESLAQLEMRITRLETSLAAFEESYTGLSNGFGEMQAAQQEMDDALAEMKDELAAMKSDVLALQTDLEDLSAAREADKEVLSLLQESSELDSARVASLSQDVEILYILELLTRARFHLAQGNTTLARVDIETARERLVAFSATLEPAQLETVNQVQDLLDDALGYLPRFPLAANDKVEGAWDLLLAGLPQGQGESGVTPEAEPTEAATSTATP